LKYNCKEEKIENEAETSGQSIDATHGFLVSQQRYIRDQILIDELRPNSQAESQNHPTEDLLLEIFLDSR
jgi:hypothetical protein